MQFEITDDAAITFSHDFYAAIADGYPVDAALAEARKAIFTSGNDVEWGTPVLYMRTPDSSGPMTLPSCRMCPGSTCTALPCTGS